MPVLDLVVESSDELLQHKVVIDSHRVQDSFELGLNRPDLLLNQVILTGKLVLLGLELVSEFHLFLTLRVDSDCCLVQLGSDFLQVIDLASEHLVKSRKVITVVRLEIAEEGLEPLSLHVGLGA